MAHPKLFTLIDAIDLKQINALRRYTLSKVSEQSEAYLIMEMIIKTKDKREKYGDADTLQKAYFPNIKTKNFVNYLSLLYGYAEEWIALTQMEEDEYTKDLLVQRWLNNRGLYSLSDQVVKKVLKKIEDTKELDLIEPKVKAELLYEHLISSNPVKYEFPFDQYLEMIQSIEEYYITLKLIVATEHINWGALRNRNIENELQYVEFDRTKIQKSALIEFTLHIYDILKYNDFNILINAKKNILNGEIKKNSKYHYIVVNHIIKKSVQFWAKGFNQDPYLVFDLTKYALKTGVFLENGKLPVKTFHNLVTRIAPYQNFEENKNFIFNVISRVNCTNKEATISLAMAQNYFYNHNYHKTFEYAWRGDFEEFTQKSLSQILLLMSSFILRNEDKVQYKNMMRSSIHFFERNRSKLSPHVYNSQLNMIKFIKLVEQNKMDENQFEKLKPVMYTTWCKYVLNLKKGEDD